jgi:hypothetical protein
MYDQLYASVPYNLDNIINSLKDPNNKNSLKKKQIIWKASHLLNYPMKTF